MDLQKTYNPKSYYILKLRLSEKSIKYVALDMYICVSFKEAVAASGAGLKHEDIIKMLNEKWIEISIMRQFITHEEYGT